MTAINKGGQFISCERWRSLEMAMMAETSGVERQDKGMLQLVGSNIKCLWISGAERF